MKSFQKPLTEEQLTILNTFNERNNCVLPDVGWPGHKVMAILLELETLQLVTLGSPYKLTEKGIRIKAEYQSEL